MIRDRVSVDFERFGDINQTLKTEIPCRNSDLTFPDIPSLPSCFGNSPVW